MSECDNFKSPKQLGLKICTSDVECYNGVILECIDLPSNPSLNNVIEATDDKICELINLINGIVAPAPVIPNDDWVVIDETDPKITVILQQGSVVWNDFTFGIAYKILSTDHAIIKFRAHLDVNIVQISDTINFTIGIDNINNSESNWFSVGDKRFQSILPYVAGDSFAVPITYLKVGGDVLGTHPFDYDIMGRAASSNGGIIVQNMVPKIANGNHIFLVEFEMVVGLQDI